MSFLKRRTIYMEPILLPDKETPLTACIAIHWKTSDYFFHTVNIKPGLFPMAWLLLIEPRFLFIPM